MTSPKTTEFGHSSIRPLLKRIGLNDKEIEIYLTILALKSAKASEIATAAKQSRSHTYLILRALSEKGLVSQLERRNVIHFVAEKPEMLLYYVQHKEKEYADLQTIVAGALPMLSSLTQPLSGQPRVTMLRGMDGMQQVYRDVLMQDFCAFFNAETMLSAFGTNVVTKLFGKNAKLRGRELFVDNAGAHRYLKEIPQDDDYEIRLLPKDMHFISEAIIFDDTVCLFAYDDEKTIMRIENKNIADMFRVWFESYWKDAKVTNVGTKPKSAQK